MGGERQASWQTGAAELGRLLGQRGENGGRERAPEGNASALWRGRGERRRGERRGRRRGVLQGDADPETVAGLRTGGRIFLVSLSASPFQLGQPPEKGCTCSRTAAMRALRSSSAAWRRRLASSSCPRVVGFENQESSRNISASWPVRAVCGGVPVSRSWSPRNVAEELPPISKVPVSDLPRFSPDPSNRLVFCLAPKILPTPAAGHLSDYPRFPSCIQDLRFLEEDESLVS